MREIKIHLTKNTKGAIFSEAIRWYQGTEYSHCAIEFRLNRLEEDVIYHSSLSTGVNFYSKELFLEKNTIIHTYEIEIEDHIYTNIMKQLIRSCGKKYATLQNIGILLVDFLYKLGLNIQNPWKQGYNCSELVYMAIIKNIYTNYPFTYNQETIRPDHIYNILESLGVEKLI